MPGLTPSDYLALGWAVVPIDPQRKTPVHANWPARAAARDFSAADFEGRNIGVVLGAVSGDLVDVDLDSDAAVALAPYFLPETLTFGRASKPASHWLYTSPGLTSEKLWFEVGDGARELVEIRATNTDGVSCGHQTVFPGSTHASGEPIEFEGDREPAPVEASELRWAVARLAVASAVLNGWGTGTGRHEKSLGLAGGLLKAGWTPDEVRHALRAVRECAGDTADEHGDFGHDVETTIKAHAAGRDVQGFGTLVEAGLLGPKLAKDIERHAMTPERRARAARALQSGSPGRQLAAGMNDVQVIRELMADRATERPQPAADTRNEVPPGEPYAVLGHRINLAEEPPELAYLFDGLPLAPGGKVNGLAGRPNAGKSPFAQLLMFAHCTGQEVCGIRPIRKGWCLYQDAETGLLAWRRWRRICRAYGVDPASITTVDFRDVEVLFSVDYCVALEDYCKGKGPNGLVVIDTYGAMLGLDIDNNSPQFAHWLRELGKLSRSHGVTILVLIHGNKTSRDGTLEGIGGNIQAPGAMQGVITLERTGKGNEAPIQVWCSRAPEHDFAPFQIRWEDVRTTPGQDMKAGGPGLRAERVEEEQVTEAESAFDPQKRLKIARSIVDQLTRTPNQSKTNVVKNTRGAREGDVRAIFHELVECGVLIETQTATRVNSRGVAEPILVYSVAELDAAGVEARMKAGLVAG